MSAEPTQGFRDLCLTCRRARSVCWCERVSPQKVDAQLVLLQHPRETRNPIGTARMAHLGWEGSHLWAGVDFSSDRRVQALLRQPLRHVVLYPTDDARDVRELADPNAQPLCIWGIDGTWWQASKLWKKNPWLRTLPAYRIHPEAPGQYRIRKEPEAHCLSTVESVAYVMDVLRGEKDPVLRPFHAMVEKQLGFAAGVRRTRHKRVPRPPRQKRTPEELALLQDHLVLIHAEGNGWPSRVVSGRKTELLQWVAYRPSTGQTFHAFVQHQTRAPDAMGWLELNEADLVDPESPAQFLARWQAFLRPTDVLGSWGWFPISLLMDAGADAPAVLNLQTLTHTHLMERTPSVEEACRRLLLEPASNGMPGRGGRRLGAVQALVSHLLALDDRNLQNEDGVAPPTPAATGTS